MSIAVHAQEHHMPHGALKAYYRDQEVDYEHVRQFL